MKNKIFTLMIATMLVMSTTLVGCNGTDTNDRKETEVTVADTEETETESITAVVTESTEVVEAVTESVTETTETDSAVVSSDNQPKEEAKSDETTSKSTTSNATSSSNESNNKPAEHVHTWVNITEDVVVTDSPATTKQELVQEAWDETIVDEPERYESHTVFNYDGYRPTDADDFDAHCTELLLAELPCNYHSEDTIIPAVTHIEHHDAVYQTVEVPAVTHVETRVVGQKCSTCGATK